MLRNARGRLFFVLAIGVAGYFAYTALVGTYRNHQLAEEERALQLEVHELREEKAYLEGIRAYVETDEYVEHEARTRLGYAREGEVPFVIVSPLEQSSDDGEAREWWERLFPR